MHERQLIRERIVEMLTGATDAGKEVYDSRPWNVWPDKRTIIVFTPRDDLELFTQAPRRMKGTISVEIVVFVRARKTATPPALIPAQQVLDAIVEQVVSLVESNRLLKDPTTGVPAAAQSPDSGIVTSIETDFDDGDRGVLGGARINVRYQYLRDMADTAVPPAMDLDSVEVEWEFEGNNSKPEAVDSVPLPG